ncbi:protein-disulfide reductase DsbD domain-containing protein [Nisaea sp.]|uniref:protein-disulfide reductase DsbD family protein n=5 Tax=Nisaea sp. TaxID=2024842 RepID=UPI003265439F
MTAILGVIMALGVFARPAAAVTGASDWVRTEFADVRLISAVAGTKGQDSVPLGLQFRLDDGWKIYWRAPGDAGYPPEIEWQGSDNLAGTAWRWPVPERFSLFGLETYGYHGEVVIPIRATLSQPGAPVALRAEMNALACSDICVPLTASLSLDLGGTEARPTAFAQLIDRFRARVPKNLSGLGLDIDTVTAVGTPEPHSLAISINATRPLDTPDIFPEARPGFAFGKPDIAFSADRRSAVLTIPASLPAGSRLTGEAITLTLVDGDRFLERKFMVSEGGEGGVTNRWAALVAVLGIAFLGGLILNLMPCVLPVLSLKLVGAVKYGGADKGTIRAGFLASAAGIVVSFLLLAGGAIALKEAGMAVGWGIQFQQPLFLALMVAILMLFAGNLLGLFEIGLPQRVSDLGLSVSGAGGHADETSLSGHFLTGAFATLLATPCSAPFLGTAIGFALSRGAVEIAVVFLVMGLGLAAPYLLVAALPGLARALPRPGAWMIWLRRVLGLALLATAVWLFTVFAATTEMLHVFLLGGVALVLTAALAWRARNGMLGRRAGAPLALAAMMAVLAVGVQATVREGTVPEASAIETAWRPFDKREISRLVAEGKTVLVDVTADWCLTCKVNKSLVLETNEISGLIESDDLVAMRADWTTPDPKIADYLASFGRYGIPFNAVYGPGAPAGLALPELLSLEAVQSAIAEAGS